MLSWMFSEECPEGWIPFENRCFYFSHLQQELLINWNAADQKCRNLREGSTLASITNRNELDFVLGTFLSLQTKFLFSYFSLIIFSNNHGQS